MCQRHVKTWRRNLCGRVKAFLSVAGQLARGSLFVGLLSGRCDMRADATPRAESSFDVPEALQSRRDLADRLLGDRKLARHLGHGGAWVIATQ